jgi:RNA polymerase sigma-70 factor (ECF subfamily)
MDAQLAEELPLEIEEPPPSGPRLIGGSDDADLARRAAAGDERAARAIWHKYAPTVRAKLRCCAGPLDLDDLVQEVFLRLFSRLADLRFPGALRSYLMGITVHVAGSALRRRRLRWWLHLTETGELPHAAIAPSHDDEQREAVERVAAAVEKLPPPLRAAFELRYVGELRLTDVAETLGVSLATAKRHLARASERVTSLMESDPALTTTRWL